MLIIFSKYWKWIGISLFLLILLAILAGLASRKVLSINPSAGATNVNLSTDIVITFSGAVDPNSAKIDFDPPVNFSKNFDNGNKRVTLHPDSPLTENTLYTLTISKPFHFSSKFMTEKVADQAGASHEFQEGEKKVIQSERPFYEQGQQIAQMRGSLPQDQPTFRVEYLIDSDTYLVRLKGANKNQAKLDFLAWLKSKNIDPNDLTLSYIDANAPSFTVIDNNFNQQTIAINQPITIKFSFPIDPNSLIITTSPDASTFYNLTNNNTSVTLSPAPSWKYNTSYTVTVHGSSTDGKNNPLGVDYTYTFKTSGD